MPAGGATRCSHGMLEFWSRGLPEGPDAGPDVCAFVSNDSSGPHRVGARKEDPCLATVSGLATVPSTVGLYHALRPPGALPGRTEP